MRRVLTAYSWSNPALGYCQVRFNLDARLPLHIPSIDLFSTSMTGHEPHHRLLSHLHVGGAVLLVLDRLVRSPPPRLLQPLDVRNRPGSARLRAPRPTMPPFNPRPLR
jgi:hypothetical protein